jgi:hypothetical protein
MKHAGPVHHDDATAPGQPGSPEHHDARPIPTAAWIAIGGTLLAGAVAAIAVPLLRARSTPVSKRRGKKATSGKGGGKGSGKPGGKGAGHKTAHS